MRTRRLIISSLSTTLALSYAATAADAPIRFSDVSAQAGVADRAVNSTGPTFVDYDNDGDIDIFVSTEGHQEDHYNRMWQNEGDGTFTNVALERGLDNSRSLSRGAAWADYDNDGDMDVVIATMPQTMGPPFQPTTLLQNQLTETGVANFKNVTRDAELMRAGN